MSNITEAADFIKRQAAIYKGFVSAAEALDRVGSLEQAATEAQTASNAAKEELSATLDELAKAKKDLTDAKAKAAAVKTDAEANADSRLDIAIANANREGAKIMEQANAYRASVLEQVEITKAASVAEFNEQFAKTDAVKAEVAALRETVSSLEGDRVSLEKAIASLKSKFA